MLITERNWPWRDSDLLSWPGLLIVLALLVMLTLWTYSGQRNVGWRKVLAVLALRLAAMGAVFLLIFRPSFASQEEVVTPGKLIIVLDSSLSMKITDAPNNSSRWDFVRKLLEWPEVKAALERLRRDKQIDIVIYQAAEDVAKYNPAAESDGKRTDIGKWLNTVWNRHHNDHNLRGVLLFTDGADNGTSYAALSEAARLRELPCPVYPFGVGSESTNKGQRDIAVVDVKADKEVVFLKNPVNIKATIDAPNLEGQNVTIRLFVDGKQVSMKNNVTLPNTRGNVVDVGQFTPDHLGESKVTVVVDEVPGEFTKLNNEMSTYINVRKEGITVLWVEGRMRLEASWIIQHALAENPRFNVTIDERLRDGPLTAEQAEYFKTRDKAFDVVVIGDVSASRFIGGDEALLPRIAKSVTDKRTGVLMLGGYQTYGNSDWPSVGKSLADLLPVDLKGSGQIDGLVRPVPVKGQESHRLLQLGVGAGQELWENLFLPLPGQAKLGKVKTNGVPLLTTDEGETLVVTKGDGPRLAVFGADTTYWAWYSNKDAVQAYKRFWTQLVAWLAHQDEGNNQVWVKLDKRRIAVGANQKLGFSVGADGKDGQPIRNARFQVKVEGPGGKQFDISTSPKLGEERATFDQANMIGEYKVTVTAAVPRPNGTTEVLGPSSSRFVAYAEDVENQQPAANHKDLIRLAAAGGGTFRMAGKEELLQYLQELRDDSASPGWVKRDLWPNWDMQPASNAVPDQLAALLQSMALPCLVVFVLCLGMEWFLRRLWGLV